MPDQQCAKLQISIRYGAKARSFQDRCASGQLNDRIVQCGRVAQRGGGAKNTVAAHDRRFDALTSLESRNQGENPAVREVGMRERLARRRDHSRSSQLDCSKMRAQAFKQCWRQRRQQRIRNMRHHGRSCHYGGSANPLSVAIAKDAHGNIDHMERARHYYKGESKSLKLSRDLLDFDAARLSASCRAPTRLSGPETCKPFPRLRDEVDARSAAGRGEIERSEMAPFGFHARLARNFR
jgi:hypothetical protein